MIPFGGFMHPTIGQVPAMGPKGAAASPVSENDMVAGMATGGEESGFPVFVQDLMGLVVSGSCEEPATADIPAHDAILTDMDLEASIASDSGAAEWLGADMGQTDSLPTELPVDPASQPVDLDPLPLPAGMDLSAALPTHDDALISIAAPDAGATQNAGRPTDGDSGPALERHVDQRPNATGPNTPPVHVQFQTMKSGGQSSGPVQESAPAPSAEGPLTTQNGDAASMTRISPSATAEPLPSAEPQAPARLEAIDPAAVRHPMDSASQQQTPVTGETVERPIVIPSPGHPAAEQAPQEKQIGNPVGAGENPASNQDLSGRFQQRDADRSPQPMEDAETENKAFSTTTASESAKPNAVEPIKAPPVFHDAARTVLSEPSATSQVKMGETPEKTFQTTVMDQIVERATLRNVQGRSEVQIRLKPDHLGNVQMNISTDKDQVIVRIMTDQPAVKEIIETHLHQLKTELGNQGLTIDRFDIAVNPDADNPNQRDQFAHMFKNHTSRDGQNQSRNADREPEMHEEEHHSEDPRPGHDGVNYFA